MGIDITTVARVKALDGSFQDAKHDGQLAAILAGVSATAEEIMGRPIERCKRTEKLNVQQHQKVFRLKAFPVQRLISVKNDFWDLDIEPISVSPDGTMRIGTASPFSQFTDRTPFAGSINQGQLFYGPGMLTVVYLGGMAGDTDDFVDAYPDIAYEADKQVLFEYRRMKTMTDKSVSAGGATTSMVDFNVLPSFKAALLRRRPKVFFV